MATKVEPFGVGIIRPFRRTPRNDFANGGGQELLASNVGQVLGTEPGELRWDTGFGVRLQSMRQRLNSDASQDLARVSVQSALNRYEPRVNVSDVVIEPLKKGTENLLDVSIIWAAGTGQFSGVRLIG
jgi:phage baseplate assembly protein W